MLFPFGNAAHAGVRNLRWMDQETDYMLDMNESELSDQSSGWGEQRVSGEDPAWADSEGEKEAVGKFSTKRDEKIDYSKYVSKVIDTKRYYVFVSPTEIMYKYCGRTVSSGTTWIAIERR